MSLHACPECGKDFSSEAEKCPHCGAPVRKPFSRRRVSTPAGCLVIIIALIVISALISNISDNLTSPEPSAAPERLDPELVKKQVEEQRRKIAAQKKADREFSASRAGKLCARHKDWDRETCKSVANGKIQIGMNAEQVRSAWGAPFQVNSTQTVGGRREQWVVHDSINSDYLYFDNGILTAIQRSR